MVADIGEENWDRHLKDITQAQHAAKKNLHASHGFSPSTSTETKME